MGYLQKQAYCHRCGGMRLHTGQQTYRAPHLLYFVLIVVLCCVWLPVAIAVALVWIFHVLANLGGRQTFLCTQCGQAEGMLAPEQAAHQAEEAARLEGIRLDIKAAARRKRRIKQAHRREMRRGRRRRRWERFDGWLERTIGEENKILLDLFRAAAHTFVWAAPFWALAAAGIVAWNVLT